MTSMYTGISDANDNKAIVTAGGALSVTTGATAGAAGFVKVTDGTNTLSVDSGGRITANSVAQAAISLYTEATTSRTTTGNSSGFFWSGNVQQVFCGVNLTALTGGTSPTVVVSLQQQDANSVYQTLGSTASLAAAGAAAFSVGTGMTNGQMLSAGQGQYRFAWTITGAPATCSFQIGLTGR